MMRYFSAGHGLKIGKKDLTFLFIYGLAILGLGYVFRGEWSIVFLFVVGNLVTFKSMAA